MESNIKKKLVVALLISAGLVGGYVALSQVKSEANVVVIGVDPYPPFLHGLMDEKSAPALLKDYGGFEATILKSQECKGIKFVMKGITFDNFQEELNTKRVDLIAGGMNITGERLQKGAFTSAYGSDGFTFVALNGEITKENLKSKKVIVQAGSVADDQAKAMGLTNIVRVKTAQEITSQLQGGLVDVAFADTPTTKTLIPSGMRSYSLTDKTFDLPYAFYGRKDDPKLAKVSACVDAYLKNHPEFTIHPELKKYN